MVEMATIGRPVGHIEGPAKVTGAARYTADVSLPGTLIGSCLRSPYPHARIVAIDTTAARALPGVHAVLTAADLPDTLIGRRILDMPVLARDKVRFQGEKVVAIAAESAAIAEEAALLVEVEYEPLPAVFDPLDAMAADAPRVHERTADYAGVHGPPPDVPNLLSQVFYRHGDAVAGFARAARVFEHRFTVPSVHQGYLEPHACLVQIAADGLVHAWLSNKTPFTARAQLTAAVGLPEERVVVHQSAIGGDFGGKGSLMDTVVAYHLAQASGRPVKMVMSYFEELQAGNPRHAAVITLRSGVDADGRLTARSGLAVWNSGAYGAFKPTPTVNLGGASHAGGPYRVWDIDIESRAVYTNTVPAGHMRAPGAPQMVFAVECHMDMIAAELGLDPVEFRRRNALREGDPAPLGQHYRDIVCIETIEAAARSAGWGEAKPAGVGRGIALYERAPGGGESNATLTLDGAARLTLLTAVPDTGTGSHTILQQIVAEEFRVPLESVTIVMGDTDAAAFDSGAGGSRVTHGAGQAVLASARAVQAALVELAARVLDAAPADLQWQAGAVVHNDGRRLSVAELMAKAVELEEGPITRTGHYAPSGHPEVTSFVAQVAEVEVDRETGQVRLRRMVSAHDVGTVLNPLTHQGQIAGGLVQGVGQALIEHLRVEEGAVTTLHLGDYKLPTMPDIPALETVLLEHRRGPAPYDGRAIGEHANVAVPAAIANAVFDAVGVRITDLPITAEKVYAALQARR